MLNSVLSPPLSWFETLRYDDCNDGSITIEQLNLSPETHRVQCLGIIAKNGKPKELEKFCETIFYYKRNNPILSLFSIYPYIVKSRYSKTLLNNLNQNKFPVILMYV